MKTLKQLARLKEIQLPGIKNSVPARYSIFSDGAFPHSLPSLALRAGVLLVLLPARLL
jgi:hypothetical protein